MSIGWLKHYRQERAEKSEWRPTSSSRLKTVVDDDKYITLNTEPYYVCVYINIYIKSNKHSNIKINFMKFSLKWEFKQLSKVHKTWNIQDWKSSDKPKVFSFNFIRESGLNQMILLLEWKIS